MKNKKLYILILANIIIASLMFSCNNEINPTKFINKKFDSLVDTIIKNTYTPQTRIDLLGIIQANYLKFRTGVQQGYYSVSAAIYQDLSKRNYVNVGSVKISDYLLSTPDQNNYYSYDFTPPYSNLPTFGGISNWSIEGNSSFNISGFDTTMYAPLELSIINNFPSKNISKSQDLNLQWNTDSQNDKGCYIVLNYRVTTSNAKDSSLPDETILWSLNVPDNGSYTISSTVLQQFPIGGVIDLFLLRGNAIVVKKNGFNFLLISNSMVWLEFDIVE